MATRRNKSRRPTNPAKEPELTPMQRALLEEGNRKVTIVVDGEELQASIGQLVSRKLLQMAAKGSVHALSNAYNEMVLAERLKQSGIEKDVAFGHQFKAHQQELLDRAIKDGVDPDTVLPHPDDILLIEGQGYRLIGPHDEFSLKLVKANCARRDAFILQHVLEERIGTAPSLGLPNDNDAVEHSSALLMVCFMNQGLSERLKLSDTDIGLEIWRHQRKSKRELLKETRLAWAKIGRPHPRGWTLPPFHELRALLEHAVPAFTELYRQVQSGKTVSEHAIAERIREIGRRSV